jgi:Glycosyltransferase (GlcNAc)
MSGPRVFDGTNWVQITVDANSDGAPPPPSEHGDGKIFVAIPTFRGTYCPVTKSISLISCPHANPLCLIIHVSSPTDGKRCADTLQSLFDNAADPDNVIVGIIEQNAADDRFCMEEFCARMGFTKFYKRQTIRKDCTKVIAEPERLKCPRLNQIRLLSFHNRAAKGPLYARSMTRKILANEEFCMQVDSHSSFRKNWDTLAKDEWKKTNNEFAVISHVPSMQGEQEGHEDGGSQQFEVPRQCNVKFEENGVPVSYPL